MTPEQAKNIVKKKFKDYVIEYCVPYKKYYIVMAHPDNGPEDNEHGAYPDPFYAVNKLTGSVNRYIPTAEADAGRGFFDVVERMVNQ